VYPKRVKNLQPPKLSSWTSGPSLQSHLGMGMGFRIIFSALLSSEFRKAEEHSAIAEVKSEDCVINFVRQQSILIRSWPAVGLEEKLAL